MLSRIKENLYLGDENAPRLLSEVEPDKATLILDLREWKFDLEPMCYDSQRKEIQGFVTIILNALDANVPTLVHCHGGIDRSPFIVACVLFIENFLETHHKDDYPRFYSDAMGFYELVKDKHTSTFIHDDWMCWYTMG